MVYFNKMGPPQPMDYNGIIVIRQVKTIGYDVDTGKLLSLIGLLYCSQKNQTW